MILYFIDIIFIHEDNSPCLQCYPKAFAVQLSIWLITKVSSHLSLHVLFVSFRAAIKKFCSGTNAYFTAHCPVVESYWVNHCSISHHLSWQPSTCVSSGCKSYSPSNLSNSFPGSDWCIAKAHLKIFSQLFTVHMFTIQMWTSLQPVVSMLDWDTHSNPLVMAVGCVCVGTHL